MKPILALALCVPVLTLAAPQRYRGGQADNPSAGPRNQNCAGRAACPLSTTAVTTPTSLPAAELVSALEEERVAHDLYAAAAARWKLRVFSNIAAAETRHASALTQLATASGIALPAAQPGVYVTPELFSLYGQLLAIVNESESGALRAGALVEETDIADLRRLLTIATDPTTRTILSNLEKASINHLLAFVGNLRTRGITYEPKVLTPAEYSAIVGG